jgi:hypothetical protein
MTTRHLAAIMFTYMVGYTVLMPENEQLNNPPEKNKYEN